MAASPGVHAQSAESSTSSDAESTNPSESEGAADSETGGSANLDDEASAESGSHGTTESGTQAAPTVPSGEPSDALQLPAAAALPAILRAPWEPAPAPGDTTTFIYGDGRRFFFGLNPATIDDAVAMAPGGTGTTNQGGDFQASVAAYGGAAWTRWDYDADRTIRFDLRGRTSFAWERDQVSTPGSKEDGYDVTLRLEAAEGEYAHYLAVPVGLPLFVAAWGGISGTTASLFKSLGTGWQQNKLFVLPVTVSLGGGVGRVYPIHGRIVIKRLQDLLLRHGAIDSEIPEGVAQQILAQWYDDRDTVELPADSDNPYGWRGQRHILTALQLLHQEGLLVQPLHLLAAYAVERIVLDPMSVDRWEGWDARLGLRTQTGAQRTWVGNKLTKADPDTTFAVEARGRLYANLNTETDLRFDPTLAVAPRSSDEIGNSLTGARRVSLAAAPVAGAPTPFFPTGRVVLDLPATLSRFVYDENYNLNGQWNIHAGVTLGYGSATTGDGTTADKAGGALALGAAYTSYSSSRTGVTLGLDMGLGYQGELRYRVGLLAAISFGTADLLTGGSRYVAPDQVGDTLPFDTDWLPRPEQVGAE